MNTMPVPAAVAPAGSYEVTRFNALRHGVLSRYAVLPWEDREPSTRHCWMRWWRSTCRKE